MTDHGFRRSTRMVIFVVSAVYLVRAAWLLWPRQCSDRNRQIAEFGRRHRHLRRAQVSEPRLR